MKKTFTQSFKIKAVEKALSRSEGTTLSEIARSLDIGGSTLSKWIEKARNHEFGEILTSEEKDMNQEKRPQDWNLEERMNAIVICSSLDDEAAQEWCRKNGIYPHHIKQWKQDFINGSAEKSKAGSREALKKMKEENKELKKELNRKEKALAEAAALLVLKKKVGAIWEGHVES